MIKNSIVELGMYFLLLKRVFSRPERFKILFKAIVQETINLGINSLPIIAIISVFVGVILAIQTAFNINSPLIPLYSVGYVVRQSVILEFSPTVIALILAGKVGSRIASEIGTMKVTEQIDALEVMGINSASYLILPKIIAAVIINPFLIIISIFLGLVGGLIAALNSNIISPSNYIFGIQYMFQPYDIFYSLIKTVVFAFIITTISGFYGYSTEGGALEVGNASTKAVVYSCIFIIVFNLLLTKLLLG